jgi:hypothetical protein
MIIAIDESGIFSANKPEYCIFLSVIIPTDDKKNLIIKTSYKNWEQKLSNKFFDKKGEVKGSLLGEPELIDFTRNVLIPFNDLRIYYIAFDTSKLDTEIVRKYLDFEVAQLELSVQDFNNHNAPKKQTNYIVSIKDWLKSKNQQEFLKILGLRYCSFNSLYQTMIYFFGNLRESEIINGSYEIDKDFINDQNIYWKGYFKQLFQEFTSNQPLPIVDTWDKENHPFFQHYPILSDNKLNLTKLLKTNFSFKDSKSSIYIRITDICGIIIYRHLNQNIYKSIFHFLTSRALTNEGIGELLMLRDFDFQKRLHQIRTELNLD